MSYPKNILLVGTGALASLFGARLAAIGVSVSMLGSWQQALQVLRTQGVCLTEPDGEEKIYPVMASASPADCGRVNYAIVLVKAWQTERVGAQLRACLAPDGIALTLQNGYGNREILGEALGPERVGLGVTTTGATLLGPGRVRAAGSGVISLEAVPTLGPLAEAFRTAGFSVEETPNVNGLVWGKLGVNAAINPLTAILEIPNGELLVREPARALMEKLAWEAQAVASAQGIDLPYEDLFRAAVSVADRTALNYSSMLQDVQRGAPTEIDAICGAIVELGSRLGVPTPINEALWRLIKAKVNG